MARNQAGTAGSEGQARRSAGRMQGTEPRADQERARQVSRENATSSASGSLGMQRSGAGRTSAGTSLAGRNQGQPSLLPAFMANPGLMAGAFMADPFAFAKAMSQEMDRLFSDWSDYRSAGGAIEPSTGRDLPSNASRGLQQGSRWGSSGIAQWNPQMEVIQKSDELVVRADLPGLSPDDVNVDVEDGVLTISGERRHANEEQLEGYYRSERSYGTFSRSLALPEGVDENRVQAHFDNGVLEVTVPIPQEQKPRGRRVQVQAGSSQGVTSSKSGRSEEPSRRSQAGA